MNKLKCTNFDELIFNQVDEKLYYNNNLYTGFALLYENETLKRYYQVVNGDLKGIYVYYYVLKGYQLEKYGAKKIEEIGTYNVIRNGYKITSYFSGSIVFTVFDMESIIELISVDAKGNRSEHYLINQDKRSFEDWQSDRREYQDEGLYGEEYDIMPYYDLQNQLRNQVITTNQLEKVRYVGGVDVSYNELEQRMIGAIVVLDVKSLQVVERKWHEMEITFPYVPGLFSFREIPPLLEAYKKLAIKPDLIICDGHGIAHPKGVGMATHLGIELDVPTIGCAKRRLVGAYDKELLGNKRGSSLPLLWDSKEVGVALRTQNGVNPVFVSIGHKIDLNTAINWVLKLSPEYRLPETTRQADHLVNTIMKERTTYDFLGDDKDEN